MNSTDTNKKTDASTAENQTGDVPDQEALDRLFPATLVFISADEEGKERDSWLKS